ncbi:MAG: 8-amino-7-oxononanoate synthase [Betaproteobacteria bacterium]|nr:8-amino-7-oxononanoate synthase [Betaproteobacteria bacterium]MDE2122247.1 8-amino-7-oxononanoate synthase [Betaproteobacteria bacterium]MDE2185950.1 8-amino-7-oxononanoate synthase [Betaproteobacteria bacterium]
MIPDFSDNLAALDAAHLRRKRRVVAQYDGAHLTVDGRVMLAFCGNDYLGLAQHPALIEAAQQAAARWGVGATASPLVCGHSAAHEALEAELAAFVGLPRALYFYAGFPANVGIVPALVERGDAVFSDALNHACLIDGARLSRADVQVYAHADVDALGTLLAASGARRKLVLTDAVFSMDGDLAPLRDMLALCERHDALLLIDDAHGFGVLGPEGRGTAARLGLRSPNLVYMATLGKAAGVAGAFVAGEASTVEWIMQRARSYIFATAAPALIAETLRASLKLIAAEDWRRAHLRALAARLQASATRLPPGWTLGPSDTAIQPIMIGDNAATLAAMAALWREGLWVPAIRPPTVPAGTARLRIGLSAAHTAAHVDRLIAALAQQRAAA